MDSFEKHGLDDDAFGDSQSGLKSFDAFPKTKPTYTSATERGGKWTVLIILLCLSLTISELRTWWAGTESHHFSVERGVGHELQLNLDIIVAMPCSDLHVNVQDATMDRIMAGDLLSKDETSFASWLSSPHLSSNKGGYSTTDQGGYYDNLNSHSADLKRRAAEEEDSHVAHVLGHSRESTRRKFAKTPKLKRGEKKDACRIYGSLEGNKVQGDFHITARGHMYMDLGGMGQYAHLDHKKFNFSHHVNELSFGPHYPNLLNPLDKTSDVTKETFYKFQYYLNIVPTIYTKRKIVSPKSGTLDPAAIPQPPTLDMQPDIEGARKDREKQRKKKGGNVGAVKVQHVENKGRGSDRLSIFTNQYAATRQSHTVSGQQFPGVYFKYDIEPILLIVSEQRGSFLACVVRLVNVISGVLVGGGWMFAMSEWALEVVGRRRARRHSAGILHGKAEKETD